MGLNIQQRSGRIANMEPFILEETFTADMREGLLRAVDQIITRGDYGHDAGFGRMTSNDDSLRPYLEYLTPLVRDTFQDDTIKPSYLMWARYAGFSANLHPHKDDNACTFTVDYCVRQREPWGLFVEGTEYILQENQSLVFMGEDQEHWRGPFAPGNMVEMIFFHYVRADHWYFNPEKERPERFRM